MEDKPKYKNDQNNPIKKWPFKTNWNNKLDCDYFTTFRFYNRGKIQIGKLVQCELIQKGQVVKSRECQVYGILPYVLKEVPEILCYMDAGYSKDEFINLVKTMYKNYKVDYDRECFAFYLVGPVKN